MAETQSRGLNQAVNDQPKSDCCERGSETVEWVITALGPAFWHTAKGKEEHNQANRQVNKKYCAPGNSLDQPSTKHGTDRCRDRSESGPNADGATAIFFGERRANDGETARYEQRATSALDGARGNQLTNARGKSAPQGCDKKKHNDTIEDPAAAVVVSQRTAHEQE